MSPFFIWVKVMSSSNGNRFRLKNNFNELLKLYMIEWWDTVQLGDKYGVSTQSVQELLQRYGYTRQYRKDCWLVKIKEANELYYTHADIGKYLGLEKRKVKWLSNEAGYKIKSTYDWFIEQNDINEICEKIAYKKVSALVKEYNTTAAIINRIKKENNANFKTMIDSISEQITNDEILNYKGTNRELAKHLNVSHGMLCQYKKQNNLQQYGPSIETKNKLLDYNWCKNEYEKHKSYKVISENLKDIGVDQVKYYIQKHHKIKKYELLDDFPMLEDKDVLIELYKNESIASLALKLDCTPWVVKQQLNHFDIPITHDFQVSVGENELYNFIKTLLPGTEILKNDRSIISPKELDIVIPSLNIAIEYSGVYYHSSKFKDDDHHKNKMELANNTGYRLITIYETEWLYQNELIKKKLSNILNVNNDHRIYARKTIVKELGNIEAIAFLNKNHIQGTVKSSYRFGLYHSNELVALMQFMKDGDNYILNRYTTGCSVVGGFTKILKHFSVNNPNIVIKTYADLRWCDLNNNIYSNNGFVLSHITKPNYEYVNGHTLQRREHYMRKHLPNKLDVFDPTLTERQNTENNELYRIYDCGKAVYLYNT